MPDPIEYLCWTDKLRPTRPDREFLSALSSVRSRGENGRPCGAVGVAATSAIEAAWEYIEGLEAALTRLVEDEAAQRAALAAEAFDLSETENFRDYAPGTYHVYMLYDVDERLLYVGQSSNIINRLGQHYNHPDRGGRIARVAMIRCATRDAMRQLETHLIGELQPELNIVSKRAS